MAGWRYMTLMKRQATSHEWQFLKRAVWASQTRVAALRLWPSRAIVPSQDLQGRLGPPSSIKSPRVKFDVLAMSSLTNSSPPLKKPQRGPGYFKKKRGSIISLSV